MCLTQTHPSFELWCEPYTELTLSQKALPAEAGGEKGLCQRQFPEEPIFTTKAYMTIVFRSTAPYPMGSGQEPGFKLVLTATKTASARGICEADYFFCGRQPQMRLMTDYLGNYPSAPDDRSAAGSLSTPMKNRTHDNRKTTRILSKTHRLGSYVFRTKRLDSLDRTVAGYCIPQSLQCDGIVHCHNARDELPSLRIEPSQIPGHLLRDLVGAHLVPTDLQNVGCITYRISDQRPRIRQTFNGPSRNRRLKNDSYYQTGSQLAVQESIILIVGCVGMFIFVGLVLLCSYHQCSQSRRFRGQQFLMPKRTARISSLISHVTRSDYELNKPMDAVQNKVQSQRSLTYHHGQLGRFTSGTIYNQNRPSVWAPVRHQVVHSATRSTLNSILESYQSSTTGHLPQIGKSATNSFSAGNRAKTSSSSQRSCATKLKRSKSPGLCQLKCVPFDAGSGGQTTRVHPQQQQQQPKAKLHSVQKRQFYPVQPIPLNQNLNVDYKVEPVSNCVAPLQKDDENMPNSGRGPVAPSRIGDHRFTRVEKQNTVVSDWAHFPFPSTVCFHSHAVDAAPVRSGIRSQPPSSSWPSYSTEHRSREQDESPKRSALGHSSVHSQPRGAFGASGLRPFIPRHASTSRSNSNTNEIKLHQRTTGNTDSRVNERQWKDAKGSKDKRSGRKHLKFEQSVDSRMRVTFAPGPRTSGWRENRTTSALGSKSMKSKTTKSNQTTVCERDQRCWTEQTLLNMVHPRTSMSCNSALCRCPNKRCASQTKERPVTKAYGAERTSGRRGSRNSSRVRSGRNHCSTPAFKSDDIEDSVAPQVCANLSTPDTDGIHGRQSLIEQSFSETEPQNSRRPT
ncbi:hypothetical protein D915_006144 [Fasciola hepatica]|uniref:CUB domain-containing protein n=1 Tax=Fasciola hepatica TaxID=6192 RepID=A0A4E0RAN4_FASHE|nr:hypothetical protein D915_006144 [Fasciola hepatica]